MEEREGEEAETVLQHGAEGISRERGSGLQDHREREGERGELRKEKGERERELT